MTSKVAVRTILHIDASPRARSISRDLAQHTLDRLLDAYPGAVVITRAISDGLPVLSEPMIDAYFTDDAARTPEQHASIAISDALVAELEAADVLVINTPVWNFGVPAALKAWIDLVARARRTFRYTENGPIGLLENKRAFIALASGGTALDSEIDFAGRYLRHVLGFLGIDDVTFIDGSAHMSRGERAAAEAKAQADQAIGFRALSAPVLDA